MGDGKIYIFCPGNIISGGVNSLLMLGRALRNNAFNAGMHYIDPLPDIINSDVVGSFNLPVFDTIEDKPGNIIVVPETMTPLLSQYTEVRKIVYWLSIRFFFKMPRHRFPFNIKLFRKLIAYNWYKTDNSGYIIGIKKRLQKWNKLKSGIWDDHIIHMTNSYFLSEIIGSYGIKNTVLLHNPVRDEFYDRGIKSERDNIILIGPKTSKVIIRLLKRQLKDYDIIRVRRVDPKSLSVLYGRSKLLVETGNTNRDRIVREAAMSGCVVMVAKSGGGANEVDVPLPSMYKIDTGRNYKNILIERIQNVCSDYAFHFTQQAKFREFLIKERSDFDERVKMIFMAIGSE